MQNFTAIYKDLEQINILFIYWTTNPYVAM